MSRTTCFSATVHARFGTGNSVGHCDFPDLSNGVRFCEFHFYAVREQHGNDAQHVVSEPTFTLAESLVAELRHKREINLRDGHAIEASEPVEYIEVVAPTASLQSEKHGGVSVGAN